MDTLKEFCDQYNIDLEAVNRIKRRVFVVGRFNSRRDVHIENGKEIVNPEVHLFTNRTDLTDVYKKNFTTSPWQMDYGRFVEALSPRVAEKKSKEGIFEAYTLVIPDGTKDVKETSYVMDTYNYFFQRAILTCQQEALRNDNPDLPRMLESSDSQRGGIILKQIRSNLTEFCVFQKESPKIVAAFIKLLSTCGGEGGLPNYAQGAPLPTGFVEKLIDFIYQEDHTVPFSSEGVQWEGQLWANVKPNPRAKQTFENLVTAFRDALIRDDVSQFTHVVFLGKSLSQHALECTPPDLRKSFRRSRDAFNGLRQILRSKVLLSMVLEWLLHAYYVAVDNQQPQDDWDQDGRVEEAILKGLPGKIAPPVKRPSQEERKKFSKALTAHFSDLIKAIVATDTAELEKITDKLPGELVTLVETLRKDEAKRKSLSTVAGMSVGPELQTAFVEAAKIILLDVLCPILYRSPTMSLADLKKLVRQETMTAYMTSVFLSTANEEAVRKIAERNLEFFESKIDKVNKTIEDSEQIQAKLLSEFVDVLCSPDLQNELKEGIRVLSEGFSLLDSVDAASGTGIAPIAVTRNSESESRDLLKRTSPSLELVKVGVNRKVERAASKILQAASHVPAAGAVAEATNGGGGGTALLEEAPPVAADSVSAEADEAGDGTGTVSDLDKKIDTILNKLSNEQQMGRVEDPKKDLLGRASSTLLGDKQFMQERADTLSAFDRKLHYIYNRYVDHKAEKKTFRNCVERMTLLNLLLMFKGELGMGEGHSNLYRLLSDLVLHLDPENPDPKPFLEEKSLTLYFDDANLADGGITALRQTLKSQATNSLGNVEAFVSELRGIKYLMDSLKNDKDAEVVVINATASEFLDWVRRDSMTSAETTVQGLLRVGKLVKHGSFSQQSVPPGLIYLTDSAFGSNLKESWLRNELGTFSMREKEFSVVLPPIALSTGPLRIGQGARWLSEAQKMSDALGEVPVPVLVLGPSPHLNALNDGFKTFLPAGYLFCGHFLGLRDQRVVVMDQNSRSSGRARAIGRNAAPMFVSLEQVIWGEGKDDKGADDPYCFAVDFYLYVVLMLWATAAKYGGARPDPATFFDRFFYDANQGNATQEYKSSVLLDPAVIGKNALAFAFDQLVSQGDLLSVSVALNPTEKLSSEFTARRVCKDVSWFNRARERAAL